jgi:hypothetical protein
MVERENEKGKKVSGRAAWLTFDQMEGAIKLEAIGALAKKWTMAFRPENIDSFKIELIADVNTLGTMYGGGLLGYGIAWFMSRWVKVPVVELGQSTAEMGQKWAQIRVAGWGGRKATRAVAKDVETFLRERNYNGMMPAELDNEEVWKAPTVAILLGCGLTIVVVTICVAIIATIAAMAN